MISNGRSLVAADQGQGKRLMRAYSGHARLANHQYPAMAAHSTDREPGLVITVRAAGMGRRRPL